MTKTQELNGVGVTMTTLSVLGAFAAMFLCFIVWLSPNTTDMSIIAGFTAFLPAIWFGIMALVAK